MLDRSLIDGGPVPDLPERLHVFGFPEGHAQICIPGMRNWRDVNVVLTKVANDEIRWIVDIERNEVGV